MIPPKYANSTVLAMFLSFLVYVYSCLVIKRYRSCYNGFYNTHYYYTYVGYKYLKTVFIVMREAFDVYSKLKSTSFAVSCDIVQFGSDLHTPHRSGEVRCSAVK